MSQLPIIDWNKGLNNYGGNESMFRMMIEKFDEDTFTQLVDDLHHSVMELDYFEIGKNTQKLKGAFSYIAAERLAYNSSLLKDASTHNKSDEVVEEYIKLLHNAKELKEFIAKLANKPVNLVEFESFEDQVMSKYPMKIKLEDRNELKRHEACCTSARCSMF